MVVLGGASTSGGKSSKPNRQGKVSKDNRRKSPLQLISCVERSIL